LSVLSLDVGDARVGVAVSDELNIAAHPLDTLTLDGMSEFTKLYDFIVKRLVKKVVVGLPLMLDGNEGEQSKKVRKFIDKFITWLNLRGHEVPEFVFWDERFTTVQASYVIRGSKMKGNEARSALDRISAIIVLQSYLDSQRIN